MGDVGRAGGGRWRATALNELFSNVALHVSDLASSPPSVRLYDTHTNYKLSVKSQ